MQGKTSRRYLLVTMLLLLLLLPAIVRAQQERFVFTTAWMAQAQFAGYYVAYERGFYKEAGLDVDIQHPTLTRRWRRPWWQRHELKGRGGDE